MSIVIKTIGDLIDAVRSVETAEENLYRAENAPLGGSPDMRNRSCAAIETARDELAELRGTVLVLVTGDTVCL